MQKIRHRKDFKVRAHCIRKYLAFKHLFLMKCAPFLGAYVFYLFSFSSLAPCG